jgi:predicted TIM-barrel fold metal-dependent hydrolase
MNMMHPEAEKLEVRNLAVLSELGVADRAAIEALPPLISTDSHVMEPMSLWLEMPSPLREVMQEQLARFAFKSDAMPQGAFEPHARVADQKRDGVQAEIIFPNNGMGVFGLDGGPVQEAAFRLYNDWLAGYCNVAPKNLFGVPCVAAYDIDAAVKEMYRAHDMGLLGVMVWQVPDPELPFTSTHYDPLWAAAAEAGAPVHMHILTGHSYARRLQQVTGYERIRGSVNQKQNDTINALFDLIFSGVFDRHPKLRVVLAESECGWLPFILQQWDYYFDRFRSKESMGIERKPSEIFNEHVYCTWLEDYSGTRQFTWWGQDNLMWSNDYSHPNSTFPYSRENILHHIGNLPADVQTKLIRDNAIRLYGLASRLEEN